MGWGGRGCGYTLQQTLAQLLGAPPHPDLSTRQRLQGHFSQACF